MEYLIKSGLKYYAHCKTILRQIRKDKSFHKWLVAHKDYSMIYGRYYCYVLIQAYKKNLRLQTLQEFEERKNKLIHDYYGKNIVKGIIKKGVKNEYKRFFDYIDKWKISEYTYLDYMHACQYLKLDLTNDDIRYPRQFKHWHDIRIKEMHVIQKEKEKKDKLLV